MSRKKPPAKTASPGRPIGTKPATPLAARLRAARLRRGLTHAQAAATLGVTPPTVQRHEAGKLEPTLATIAAYARLYQLDTRDLAYGPTREK